MVVMVMVPVVMPPEVMVVMVPRPAVMMMMPCDLNVGGLVLGPHRIRHLKNGGGVRNRLKQLGERVRVQGLSDFGRRRGGLRWRHRRQRRDRGDNAHKCFVHVRLLSRRGAGPSAGTCGKLSYHFSRDGDSHECSIHCTVRI